MKICRKISFPGTLIRRKLQTVSVQVTTLRALNDFWFVFTTALGTAGHQHQATHPLRQSHEWEILGREVREALLNLKALSFDAPSQKGPTNYQLTTVGWLPLNVVAARGQNTFVSTIKNLDFKHFYSCDYCVWCGRLILSPNVQIYPRIKQHLRPIMPGPGLELQTIHRLSQSWRRSLFLVQCAA